VGVVFKWEDLRLNWISLLGTQKGKKFGLERIGERPNGLWGINNKD